jgi:hypothetical protein
MATIKTSFLGRWGRSGIDEERYIGYLTVITLNERVLGDEGLGVSVEMFLLTRM